MADVNEPLLIHDAHGLPIWYSEVDGPVTAALTFRVGVGDEPLPRRGFTHMVEHLALHGFSDPRLNWNGFVDLNRTVFFATGEQEPVEKFLCAVADGLRRLDADRLSSERRVLMAEARSRGPMIAGELFSRRWGARGYGSSGWWEMGIRNASFLDLDQWMCRHFTRENAVLWMSARPSDGFTLDLRAGERIPAPSAPPIVEGRAWFRHNVDAVAFLARVPRTPAASLATGALTQEAHRRLREMGLCYSVNGSWNRLGADEAAVILSCDTVPNRERDLAHALLALVDEFGHAMPQQALDDVQVARTNEEAAQATRGYLDAWSHDLLLGRRRETVAESEARLDAVTVEDARAAIARLRQDLLLLVPQAVAVAVPDIGPYPTFPSTQRAGRVHRFAVWFERADADGALTIGDEGIALQTSQSAVSVDWLTTSCTMRWLDGTRYVIDDRGQGVLVEPTRFENGEEAIEAIDRRVPPASAVTVGPRYARPVVNAGTERGLRAVTAFRTIAGAALAFASAVAVMVGCALVFDASGDPLGIVVGLAPGLTLVAGLIAFARLTTRSPRAHTWDDCNTWSDLPDHVDKSTWVIPIGLLLGWVAARDRIAHRWRQPMADDLAEYRAGIISGPELYRRLGGVLTVDLVDDDTNEFFTDYLAQHGRGYDKDLARTLPAPSYFDIPETRESQEAVNAALDRAYQRWHRLGRWRTTRHLRRLLAFTQDGRWRGQQTRCFAASVIQWFRKQRWR